VSYSTRQDAICCWQKRRKQIKAGEMIKNNLPSDTVSKLGFSLGTLTGIGFLLGVFAAVGDTHLLPSLAGIWGIAWLVAQIPLFVLIRRDMQKKAYVKQPK
jgi:hypothetical protein